MGRLVPRVAVLLAAVSLVVSAQAASPVGVEAAALSARTLLSRLDVSAETSSAAYSRSAFTASGQPTNLSSVPLISLREAWQSGARRWDATVRARFAELGPAWSPRPAGTVYAAARGARDPGAWLPATGRCSYVTRWLLTKYRWSLTIDRRERSALAEVLTGRCGGREVALPRRVATTAASQPVPLRKPTPRPTRSSPRPTATPTPAAATPTPTSTLTPSATPAPSPEPTTSPLRAVVSGTAVSASSVPLVGLSVAIEDAAGTVVAQTLTGDLGEFRLETAAGPSRLVVASGTLVGRDVSLPDRFRWSAGLDVTGDVTLPLRLPLARRVTVVATDGYGRPIASSRVGGIVEADVTAAALWPGGPVLAGRQSVATEPISTGDSGKAVLWSFPTGQLSAYVENNPAPGIVARSDIILAVAEDVTVAAMPGRSACTPRAVTDLGPGPVRLVSDLDRVTVRDSASKAALLRRADEIVSGAIPAVAHNSARTGDALRYLYDEGVALRRATGILAYAYAARRDVKYLDAMATTVAVNAARWPDWNPGHPLDTAQIATAVALAYGWSGARMSPAQRGVVADALATRMVLSYSCSDGQLSSKRAATGNQNTVIATAAVLAGLAVRNDATVWGSAAVEDGAGALARFRLADGTGRSLASGPTVEGLMYTTYEAANLSLVHATAWRNDSDPVVAALRDRLADLDVLAAWNERCGTVADPAVEDGWDFYPWVDRTTALATLARWPAAGGHVLELLDELQARETLTIPDRGSWTVPDGIAELIVSGLSPRRAAPPSVQSYAPVAGGAGSYWGCASNGALRALTTATPNNAPHGHRDIGNLVVSHGAQTVLADLGQRDYNFVTPYPWRSLTKAHSTVGVLQSDGRVTQTDTGSGSVSATGDGLVMVSPNAMSGVDWTRGIAVTGTSMTVRDQLRLRSPGTAKPLSVSFLLATPAGKVTDLGGGRFRVALGDGSTWELTTPAGVTAAFSDARPTTPYADTAEFSATLGPAHTLVVLTPTLVDSLDLTTTLVRLGP